jgi:hypothetical protein
LNIVVTYGMKQQYTSLVLSLNAHIRKQGSRGKQREAEGSRGKQRVAEGSRGKQREAEGSRGKQREAEGSRGKTQSRSIRRRPTACATRLTHDRKVSVDR